MGYTDEHRLKHKRVSLTSPLSCCSFLHDTKLQLNDLKYHMLFVSSALNCDLNPCTVSFFAEN